MTDDPTREPVAEPTDEPEEEEDTAGDPDATEEPGPEKQDQQTG